MLVLDWLVYNINIIKLNNDHTGNMHDTIDAQQITAPIRDMYLEDWQNAIIPIST